MAELGRQTPTRSVVLPYEKTKGAQAVKLYNLTGRKAQEWQELMLYDIMSVGADGLWTHVKFGYSLPRRNGKSEILIARALGPRHWRAHTHKGHTSCTQRTARRPRMVPGKNSWALSKSWGCLTDPSALPGLARSNVRLCAYFRFSEYPCRMLTTS